LVLQAQDLIYACDARGRLTFVNPAICRVTEYHAAELLGRHVLTLIDPRSRDRASEFYARQLRDRIASTYCELPAMTKDRQIVWIGQHVQLTLEGHLVVGIRGIARDITAQKKTEEHLRQSEAKYRSLIEGAAYGIYRASLDGRILDANPAFARLLGHNTVDDVLRLNMADAYRYPEDRDRIIQQHEVAGAGATEAEWIRSDGTPITVSLTARSVHLAPDGVRGFEGVVEDITAKHALEAERREAQKMEAVALLARRVAHDFNNVLAAILGAGDLIATRLSAGDPSRADALDICKAAERGAVLTRQLLTHSRREASGVERLDLGAAIRRFRDRLQRLVGREDARIAIAVETPAASPIVGADLGQVERIVTNLVVNARDAMPAGGTISLAVEAVSLDTRATLAYPGLRPGAYGKLSVRDSGVGMPPSVQQHIFEPFFTTKSSNDGGGVGLSIVFGIAKELGGAVGFSSTPGAGTTFDVLIPIASERTPSQTPGTSLE
jgi:PAS domain S-box-containing protein